MTPNASPFSAGPIDPSLAGLLANARRQFADGLNTWTFQGWQIHSFVKGTYEAREELKKACPFLHNVLSLREDPQLIAEYNAQFRSSEKEIPITLQWSFGSYPVNGTSLFRGQSLRADTIAPTEVPAINDSADPDYCEVYHTCVTDLLAANPGKGLRELIGNPTGTFA